MNYFNLMKSCLIIVTSSFSSLTPMNVNSVDIETGDVASEGYGCVSYELEEMGFDLSVFGQDYELENEVLSCTQSYDSDMVLRTYIYIFNKNFNTQCLTASISTSLDKDSESNFIDNYPADYSLSLVSYNTEKCLKKYLVNGLSFFSTYRRVFIRQIDYILGSETGSIGVTSCYVFKGSDNDSLESYYEKMESVIITKKIGCIFPYVDINSDGSIPSTVTGIDNFYLFFNCDVNFSSIIDLDITYYTCDYFVNELLDTDKVYSYDYLASSVESKPFVVFNGVAQNYPTWVTKNDPVVDTIEAGETTDVSTTSWKFIFKTTSKGSIDKVTNMSEYHYSDNDTINLSDFSDYSWGINYYNSSRTYSNLIGTSGDYTRGSCTYDISLLRIKGYVDGEILNLSCVDSKVDNSGSTLVDPSDDFWDKLYQIILAVGNWVSENYKMLLIIGGCIGGCWILYLLQPIIPVLQRVISIFVKVIVFAIKLVFYPLKVLFTWDFGWW